MAKHSRRYDAVAERIEPDKLYQPEEAIDLLKELANTKFDETMEIHIRTGADPRHADQMVREVAVLPHGLGKQIRVLVFTSGEGADIARQAGADYVGDDDLIAQIEGGWVDFEVGLATPEIMPKIGKLGRVLGRRGPDAQPQDGYHGPAPGFGAGDRRVQGRPRGVPNRPDGHHSLLFREGQFRHRAAAGKLGSANRFNSQSPTGRGQGRVPALRLYYVVHGTQHSPGVKRAAGPQAGLAPRPDSDILQVALFADRKYNGHGTLSDKHTINLNAVDRRSPTGS